jgi:hypothetical protein
MPSTYRDVGLALIGAALMAVFLYISGSNQISEQFEQLVTNSKTKAMGIQKNDDDSISMKNERLRQYYLQQSKERQQILGESTLHLGIIPGVLELVSSFLLFILGKTGLTMGLMASCSQLRRSHQECITKAN